ncbi:nucleoside diphosphate-linked moiety X motif 8 isoform X2 [Thalassophryne amazonica]|uniref:nucleoside diphosphate-linked moiety X motif 8 isoform X2 n=1 Tax=Thalassophryne amazonica TaxID=390379 RepID=UPI001470C146|nr:nucleoside diphosphate-linked moiety X motif 8 isoform X2 [Thalassophryne amazonica]
MHATCARITRGQRVMKASLTQTWPCFIRLLLLGKQDFQAHIFTANTAGGWHSAKAVKERRGERNCSAGSTEGSFSSTETMCASLQLCLLKLDRSDHQQREATFYNSTAKAILSNSFNLSWFSPSAKNNLAVPQSCNSVEVLSDLRKCHEHLMSRTCLQHWKNPQDTSLSSLWFSNKRQSKLFQSCLACSQHFIRPLSTSARKLWVFNHFHMSFVPSIHILPQSRAAHQTPSYQATPFRDILSLENEMRCRQALRPNLKLYELNMTNGAVQRQGKDKNWASILVSLCSLDGDPAFLFTLRSSTLKGRHKGHVSFAGGKKDPSDSDVVATALREAWEEIGINVATESVWGVFRPLIDGSSGLMVVPVLANLGPLESLSFKPNPSEVEEIFTLPLSHLCDSQNRGYTHFRTGDKYGYTLPVFRNGKHRVWGLTAIALDNSLKLIIPP